MPNSSWICSWALFTWVTTFKNYFPTLFSRTRKRNLDSSGTPSWPDVWAATSIFLGVGYWQAGRGEKPQYSTSSCSNFSSLLLKWCCRCCKLETELIMNKVNRSRDPILQVSPWSDFAQVWRCKGKSYMFTARVRRDLTPLCENTVVMWCFIMSDVRKVVSRTIKFMSNTKWPFCIHPLSKQSL